MAGPSLLRSAWYYRGLRTLRRAATLESGLEPLLPGYYWDASATNYTLAADGGAFTLTGNNAGLRVSRSLVAAGGSYAFTGSDAGLRVSRRVVAASGAFTLTGDNATLAKVRRLAADGGSYVLMGQDAGLRLGRRLTAAAGAYVLTGADATLTVTGAPQHYTITASAGVFFLTGGDTLLLMPDEFRLNPIPTPPSVPGGTISGGSSGAATMPVPPALTVQPIPSGPVINA